jgi:hypothetical protein
MPTKRARTDLVQELKKLLCSITASCFVGLQKGEDFAAARCERIVDMVHREIFENASRVFEKLPGTKSEAASVGGRFQFGLRPPK